MRDNRDYLIKHGWDYILDGEWLILKGLPVVFGQKFKIEQLLHSLLANRSLLSARPKIPPYAHEVLKSKACRYAVKFGQTLSLKVEAPRLVDLLKLCKRPFICAHGRPTIYVLGRF